MKTLSVVDFYIIPINPESEEDALKQIKEGREKLKESIEKGETRMLPNEKFIHPSVTNIRVFDKPLVVSDEELDKFIDEVGREQVFQVLTNAGWGGKNGWPT